MSGGGTFRLAPGRQFPMSGPCVQPILRHAQSVCKFHAGSNFTYLPIIKYIPAQHPMQTPVLFGIWKTIASGEIICSSEKKNKCKNIFGTFFGTFIRSHEAFCEVVRFSQSALTGVICTADHREK